MKSVKPSWAHTLYSSNAGAFTQGDLGIAIGPWSGNIAQKRNAIALGYYAGYSSQGTNAIAIGGGNFQGGGFTGGAGYVNQGSGAIAIGVQAGYTLQGINAIAIGSLAGQTNQAANTIVLNATGTAVTGAGSSGTYIAPVRNQTQTTALGYNTSTSEITYYNMTGAGTVTALTAGTTNTLTVNFNSYFQGTSYVAVSTGGTATTTINAFNFTNPISQGQYTIIIAFTQTVPSNTASLIITAPTSTIYRCNFASVTVTCTGASGTQANPKYIVLTVAYDANPPNSTRWFISASGFNS